MKSLPSTPRNVSILLVKTLQHIWCEHACLLEDLHELQFLPIFWGPATYACRLPVRPVVPSVLQSVFSQRERQRRGHVLSSCQVLLMLIVLFSNHRFDWRRFPTRTLGCSSSHLRGPRTTRFSLESPSTAATSILISPVTMGYPPPLNALSDQPQKSCDVKAKMTEAPFFCQFRQSLIFLFVFRI